MTVFVVRQDIDNASFIEGVFDTYSKAVEFINKEFQDFIHDRISYPFECWQLKDSCVYISQFEVL